jgi:pimeloyl-ACP methyl ester carboxylesterase
MGKIGKIWRALLAGGAGMATLAAFNAAVARGVEEPEPNMLGGEAGEFPWKHGQISYKTAGEADLPPLVFLHGIGVGSSRFVWRRNFEALARHACVYAPDLLGFGFSDKPALAPYSADLYVELIADFIREVVARPARVVASWLSAAYAARVAAEHPALVESLVLISPTGVGTLRARPGMTGAAFYGLLHSPVLGASFYNALTSERSLREYAREQLFYDKRLATKRLIARYHAISHLPGAQYALAAFLSGYLNTDMADAFARLDQPVLLIWGREDRVNPVEHAAALLQLNPRARLEVFNHCRMMPQEEHSERFNDLIRHTLSARSAAA